MKNNKMIPILVLVLATFGLLGYYSYIAVQKPCVGTGWTIPGPSPLRFGPYYMVTDKGRLYIGQTYEHRNEGPWVGNLTLLYMNKEGAGFLVRYPKGSGSDFEVMKCIKFYPRTSENKAEK
jgi:hypothetical protein